MGRDVHGCVFAGVGDASWSRGAYYGGTRLTSNIRHGAQEVTRHLRRITLRSHSSSVTRGSTTQRGNERQDGGTDHNEEPHFRSTTIDSRGNRVRAT